MVVDTEPINYTPSQSSVSTQDEEVELLRLKEQQYDSSVQQYDTINAPKDRFLIIYLIFVLQGAGILFPFNAFISAPDYFNGLYGDSFTSYLSIANSVPNLLGLIVMIIIGHKLPILIKTQPAYFASLCILLAVPILGIFLLFFPSPVFTTISEVLTLIFMAIVGLATAWIQGGIFGFAGIFPAIYVQAVMTGNGVAGVLVSLIRILTKVAIELPNTDASGKVDDRAKLISTVIYFVFSALVVFICFILMFIVTRLPFTKYYMKMASENSSGASSEKKKASLWTVLSKIWIHAILIILIFWLSLLIFPGLCFTIPSYWGNQFAEQHWLAVLITLIFNVFDLLGRFVPRFVVLFKSPATIAIPTVLRFLLLPLFIFCINPTWFQFDLIPMILMAVLAFSSGYLSSLVMMSAPSECEPHERSLAGTLMTFFLLLGITMGSNTALVLSKFLF